jgi:hypothetical protein
MAGLVIVSQGRQQRGIRSVGDNHWIEHGAAVSREERTHRLRPRALAGGPHLNDEFSEARERNSLGAPGYRACLVYVLHGCVFPAKGCLSQCDHADEFSGHAFWRFAADRPSH